MIQLNDTIFAACTHLNNYFVQSTTSGDFVLKDGNIKLERLFTRQSSGTDGARGGATSVLFRTFRSDPIRYCIS